MQISIFLNMIYKIELGQKNVLSIEYCKESFALIIL